MDHMKRYAVYYAPRDGAFASRAAAWIGRDPATGQAAQHPDIPGVDVAGITRDARRYGFHGTIRAPFRAAPGTDASMIAQAVADLAKRLKPVTCTGLRLENLHGFLALTPEGCEAELVALAATVVEVTNPLRTPISEAEIAKRRPETLTPRQRALLDQWGYPFVMEEFRFHLTLTDRMPPDLAGVVQTELAAQFGPVLPRPFVIEDLCLFGEDAAGLFHLLHRYALSG